MTFRKKIIWKGSITKLYPYQVTITLPEKSNFPPDMWFGKCSRYGTCARAIPFILNARQPAINYVS